MSVSAPKRLRAVAQHNMPRARGASFANYLVVVDECKHGSRASTEATQHMEIMEKRPPESTCSNHGPVAFFAPIATYFLVATLQQRAVGWFG